MSIELLLGSFLVWDFAKFFQTFLNVQDTVDQHVVRFSLVKKVVVLLNEFIFHSVKLRKVFCKMYIGRKFLTTYWQKLRESTSFTKEITKCWFDEFFFQWVWILSFFHTVDLLSLENLPWNQFTVWLINEKVVFTKFFICILGHNSTVWEFQDFTITQILREINFVHSSISAKTAIFAILGHVNFVHLVIFSLQKMQKSLKSKIQSL